MGDFFRVFFDFTPTGDIADASGSYSKIVTGLTSGVNYTIVVHSAVNNNEQDTNDTGQVLTGAQSGATANCNNLQVLNTLGANLSTDAGDRSQFVSWPITFPAGNGSTAFTIGGVVDVLIAATQ